MRKVHIGGGPFRELFLAALIAVATCGCFLNEIDKSVQSSPMGAQMKAEAAAKEKEAADKDKTAKQDGKAGKPPGPQGASWWAKASSLSSEESTAHIVGCRTQGGKTDFMTRDDCLARGGVPQ
jgi:hypothetical protein